MKNVTTFDNFPTFAENGSRNMNTESAKYQIGFVEADTFPAEWCNYLFHGATKGVSDLNTAVQSIWQENINVITQSGQTPNPNSTNQLYTAIQTFINNAVLTANAQVLAQAKLDAHPVGSYYWSDDSTDPSTLFGGTWTRIKDRFVLAKGDIYTGNVGSMGGNASVTLSVSNLPSHSHYYTPSGTVANHNHENLHRHYIDFTTGRGLSNDGYFDRGNPSNSGSTAVDGTIFVKDTTITHRAEYEGNDYGYNPRVYAFLSHSHSVSGYTQYDNSSTGFTQPSFSGSRDTTETSGSDTAFSVLNPYVLAYCWRRTA
jgi:hypothetical protein